MTARPRLSLSAAATAPSSSGSSDSSSFSSSSIAQLAPPGAVLLPEPGSISSSSSSSSSAGSEPSAPERAAVVVVGVDHGDRDPSLGSFILSAGPAAVVVETALCARHGRETGTTLTLPLDSSSADDDGSAGLGFGGGGRWETSGGVEIETSPFEDAGEEHVVQCLHLAERLASMPDGSPEKTSFWQALSAHFAGEQLAYVAALASGARLVFGDRAKRATVRRLLGALSAADLDRAVAAQAARNTSEQLAGSVAPPPPLGGGDFGRAYDVLVRERDAALCSAVAREVEREERRAASVGGVGGVGGDADDDASSSSSTSTSTSFPPSSSAASSGGPPSPSPPPRPIVVVVGKWHLEGVRSLWESGEWRGVLQGLEAEEGRPPPPPPARHPALSASEDLGLRRALVDELLRTTATAASAEEVDPEAFGGALVKAVAGGGAGEGEEEAAAQAAFALATELYGTARMQLALLDSRQQFDAVVSGWRCDFWEEVAPVRNVRAAKGGRGFFGGEEILTLRGLNYIFEESD